MNQSWKKSVWTKLIAACFIGLVVLGNIWLIQRFSVDIPPVWMQACFATLTGAVFLFGAALLAEQFLRKISESDERQMEREENENSPRDRD